MSGSQNSCENCQETVLEANLLRMMSKTTLQNWLGERTPSVAPGPGDGARLFCSHCHRGQSMYGACTRNSHLLCGSQLVGMSLCYRSAFRRRKLWGLSFIGGASREGGENFAPEDSEMGTLLSTSPRGKLGRGWWKAFGVLDCVSQKQTNEK